MRAKRHPPMRDPTSRRDEKGTDMRTRCSRLFACACAGALLPGVALAQSSPVPTGSDTITSPTVGGDIATGTSEAASEAPRDRHEDPSTIGASVAPVPVATAGERASATAPQPGHAAANRPREEDNGRSIDFIFIQAEGGASVVDLTGLSSSGRVLPTLVETRQSGYGGGATIGFRSWIFAIAAHGYISRFVSGQPSTLMGASNNQSFDLGQVMLEGQLRVPLPIIEPYVRVGVGYAWLGAFELNSMYQSSTSDVHGWTAKAGLGLDVWLGKLFTVGAGADFALMNLRRGGVQRDASVCPQTDPTCVELRQDGDALGWLITAHVQAGLHF